MENNTRGRDLLILAILSLALLLPFIGKAFHMDDTYYLTVIKAITSESLPLNALINYHDVARPVFEAHNPPLYSYILAPFYSMFGPNAIALHLVSILFAIMGILSFYLICEELDIKKPLYASLVFLAYPIFIVGLNIMLDVPALSLSLLAFYLFLRSCRNDSIVGFVASGLILGSAILVKYFALALIGPLFIYALVSKNRRGIISVVIAMLAFVAWNVYSYYAYGRVHFMGSELFKPRWHRILLLHPLALICVVGMLFPYAVVLFKRRHVIITSIITLVVAIVVAIVSGNVSIVATSCLMSVGMILGIYFLYLMFKALVENIKRFDPLSIFLFLWIGMIILMNTVFVPFVAPRNISLMVPAMILILFKYLILDEGHKLKLKIVIGSMLFISLILGYVDYRYADCYKIAAKEISQSYKGNDIWFFGHWGWQYYAGSEGFKQISVENRQTNQGDIIVFPENADKGKIYRDLFKELKSEGLKLVEVLEYKLNWIPIRSHGELSHAGFYASEIYRPPYAISFAPLEVFRIYRVE